MPLSSRNVDKYEFLTCEDVLSVKGLLEKTLQSRIEYSPLGSELKNQTEIAKDQCHFFKDQMNAVNNNRWF